ncbi:MAG: tetratricopeptide repeat protein, partial [bacterium]|nr:tetratricopeptide repeat protein [bacterium]
MLRCCIALLPPLILLTGCTLDPEVRKQRLVDTGNKYFEAGKHREASIIYRRAIQQDRRFGEAYYRLGLVAQRMGRLSEAIAAFTRATELQPENEDAFGKLADIYLMVYFSSSSRREAYLREINRLTERAERNFPEAFDVNRVRGFVALTQKKLDVAIKRLRAANQQRPEHSGVALGLAQALDTNGEIEEAEAFARQFIEDHPN